MLDIKALEHRLIDVSQYRPQRYKGAGMRLDDRNQGFCTAEMSLMIRETNTAHGGTSLLPWGLYFLHGDVRGLQQPPAALQGVPFLETVPADKEDPRAVKLDWNETGTQARLGFTAVGVLLGLTPPQGATLWLDAYQTLNTDGKPVIVLPLGDQAKLQRAQSSPPSSQGAGPAEQPGAAG